MSGLRPFYCPVELRFCVRPHSDIGVQFRPIFAGIPFEIKIPNDETLEAIKDARANKNMTKVSLEDLKKDLGA